MCHTVGSGALHGHPLRWLCVVADTKVIVLTAETCIMEKNITDVIIQRQMKPRTIWQRLGLSTFW